MRFALHIGKGLAVTNEVDHQRPVGISEVRNRSMSSRTENLAILMRAGCMLAEPQTLYVTRDAIDLRFASDVVTPLSLKFSQQLGSSMIL